MQTRSNHFFIATSQLCRLGANHEEQTRRYMCNRPRSFRKTADEELHSLCRLGASNRVLDVLQTRKCCRRPAHAYKCRPLIHMSKFVHNAGPTAPPETPTHTHIVTIQNKNLLLQTHIVQVSPSKIKTQTHTITSSLSLSSPLQQPCTPPPPPQSPSLTSTLPAPIRSDSAAAITSP